MASFGIPLGTFDLRPTWMLQNGDVLKTPFWVYFCLLYSPKVTLEVPVSGECAQFITLRIPRRRGTVDALNIASREQVGNADKIPWFAVGLLASTGFLPQAHRAQDVRHEEVQQLHRGLQRCHDA